MKISQDMSTARSIAPQVQVAATREVSGGPVSENASAAADQTHLSGAASLASRAASVPDVRQEKVAAVQAAISNGAYNISSQDVAQSLIGHMLGNKA